MSPENTPITDQLANVSPVVIVAILTGFTLLRLTLARVKDQWARTISETCDTINFVLALAFLLIRPFVAQAFYIPSESMEYTLLKRDRLIVDKFSYRTREPQRGEVVVFEAPPAATDGQAGIDFIKRLIAVPGDTIEVRAAQVRIDGNPVDPIREYGLPDAHAYLRYRLGLRDDDSVKIFKDHLLVGDKQQVTTTEIAQQLGQPGAKVELVPGQTLLNGKPLEEPYTREDPGYNLEPVKLESGQLYVLGDNRNRSRDSHAWGALERRRIVGRAVVVFWPPARVGAIH